jgi:hypothetical protein
MVLTTGWKSWRTPLYRSQNTPLMFFSTKNALWLILTRRHCVAVPWYCDAVPRQGNQNRYSTRGGAGEGQGAGQTSGNAEASTGFHGPEAPLRPLGGQVPHPPIEPGFLGIFFTQARAEHNSLQCARWYEEGLFSDPIADQKEPGGGRPGRLPAAAQRRLNLKPVLEP